MRNTESTSWIPRLLGLDPNLFAQCSAHLRARGKVTLFAMLALHSFTALTISLGLYGIFGNLLIALPAFAILTGILFTADRLLITGSRHWSASAMRILLALVLPIFNVAFFDLLFFDADIRALHQDKQAEQAAQIQGRHEAEAAPFIARIDNLNRRIGALNDSIRLWQGLNIRELHGTGGTKVPGDGPVYKAQQPHIAQLAAGAESEITDLKLEIEKLEQGIAGIEARRKREAAALPAFESTGFAYRLNMLHAKFAEDGNWAIKLVSCCYFLFFAFFDGLLLLPAIALPFGEYHKRAGEVIEQQGLLFQFRQSQCCQLQTAEIQMEIERKLLALQYEAGRDAAREALEDIERQLAQELKLIEALQREEKSLNHRLERDFEKMAQVALLKSMDRLEALFASKA